MKESRDRSQETGVQRWKRIIWVALLSLAFLTGAVRVLAQEAAPTADEAATQPTFSTAAQLVVQTVTVKDRDGNPIEGLKPEDFTITENNVPQSIAFLEYQELADTTFDAPYTERAIPIPRLAHTQISAEPQGGELRYDNRRLLALYFDMTSLPFADRFRALEAAQTFIRTQMRSADLVAILAYSGGAVDVHEDFTDDRDRLLSTLQTMIVGEDENAPQVLDDGVFGQNGGEFNIFRTDRQLAALQNAAQMLGRLSEKKSLIYFASGLRLNGTDNHAQLRATINEATRAGVSFFTVDARGLTADAPLGNATQRSPGGQDVYSGASALRTITERQRTQDTLWTLAADTGGKALLDVNDLGQGIVDAQQAITSYYVLGYYTSNTAKDGKLRRIKITLNNGMDAVLEYRGSYYADKEFKDFSEADRERQLEEALMLENPITELTIALELNYFQLNRAEYFVPLAVKIPGSELAVAKRGGHEHTEIDFIGEIRGGGPVTNLRDKIDIELTSSTAEQLETRPITYDAGFTVFPGTYRIKFLARDLETGRIGTYETAFTIPNLNKEEERVAISSVVLSSQQVPLSEAVAEASGDRDKRAVQQAVNPLIQQGAKLIPSVTRVFSQRRDMYVYLQAYQQKADPVQPLLAYVTFYRGEEKVMETQPVTAVERVENRLNTMPIKLSFPLGELAPGEYLCQVTVLDPGSRKAAFWQTPVMIVP